MAAPRVTINDLPEKTSASPADLLLIQDGTVSKKMTMQHVIDGTGVSTHIAQTTDAHDATAISAVSNGPSVSGANVQVQLGQLAGLVVNAVTGDGIRIIRALTQAAYDSLAVKDPQTLYVITS